MCCVNECVIPHNAFGTSLLSSFFLFIVRTNLIYSDSQLSNQMRRGEWKGFTIKLKIFKKDINERP